MLTMKQRLERALMGEEDAEALVMEITGVTLSDSDYSSSVTENQEIKLNEEEEILFGRICAQILRNKRTDWPRVDWNCVGCY